mmetsp:Transcript_2081/g.2639  ORF Transcript_2081/g.2639 Transcript_2081/m.2639 type:complete len:149 (-) Transcript_2081:986-1432(-)
MRQWRVSKKRHATPIVPLMVMPICKSLHKLLSAICIVNQLLAFSPSCLNRLALEMGKGMLIMAQTELELYAHQLINSGGQMLALSNLLGILDNCLICFPKLCHATSACTSLIVGHEPSGALVGLDRNSLITSIMNYLQHNIQSLSTKR